MPGFKRLARRYNFLTTANETQSASAMPVLVVEDKIHRAFIGVSNALRAVRRNACTYSVERNSLTHQAIGFLLGAKQMLPKDYIVMKRSGQWWMTLDGERHGPYVSQKVAVDAAIYAAKLDFRLGQSARVSIDEPDDGVPIVYETDLN